MVVPLTVVGVPLTTDKGATHCKLMWIGVQEHSQNMVAK